MRKRILITSITLIILTIIAITATQIIVLTPTSSAKIQPTVLTKAICNKTNFCQDYIITCLENRIIKVEPIENATVQFSQDWQDPRNEEEKEKLCN